MSVTLRCSFLFVCFFVLSRMNGFRSLGRITVVEGDESGY